ncbi:MULTISPECIES: arsenical pump-driving ATPase [Paenibacillus]|uniref:arsenical pump-driving ATPase n=1 Tax=Paenibacillus TaxID=44249 RepID=UPI00048C6221|nr:arsenical pump-driving ATPase [Paenibacillus sp. IHBB 10380]
MTRSFHPNNIPLTPYLFFTGKGGVGKTSTASATAISLADAGKRVLLVSTDPASNLQDVFGMTLSNHPVQIQGAPNLYVANLDPETAASEYKAQVVDPYRGKLPDTVIATMEEQLSGACTVEIAAFNEFSTLLTNQELKAGFDHILFDTAPTGHTLRLLQLPTAWSGFLDESTHGASCLGPLAGLESKKELYSNALATLNDEQQTTLVLVTRPDRSPLLEAARTSSELREMGMNNQILVMNGTFVPHSNPDPISEAFYKRQQIALDAMPENLKTIPHYEIPLVPYNLTGLTHLRQLFSLIEQSLSPENVEQISAPPLSTLIRDISSSGVRVVFTMGKGGVGKTTIASAIAVGLAEQGHRVHLSTTDPAAHLNHILDEEGNNHLSVSRVDPRVELEKYRNEVLSQNADSLDEDGLAYLEEDLRSPCTEEIAVFRAFAELVERSQDEIVVIDTAPTGHTLLLLDATQEYHKEIERSSGAIPDSVKHLLPRLRNPEETSVVIVTLAEATPFYEASRLNEDLKRANIPTKWWAINQSFAATQTTDPVLQGRASSEAQWISQIKEASANHSVIIPWEPEEIKGYDRLKKLAEK